MKKYKDIIYILSCMFFTIIIGAGFYEHICVWSEMSIAPPASLTMFDGIYGLDPGKFWSFIHPVTLLLMITSLTLFWKSERKKNLIYALIGYMIVNIVTFIYFVPEIMNIVQTPISNEVNESLKNRADLWVLLSYLRLIILAFLSVNLLFGLTKTD